MNYTFKNIDSDDLDDIIRSIEDTFQLRFSTYELQHISDSNELTDYIIGKLNKKEVNDCTTQQAFYKLRDAVSDELQLEKKNLTPKSLTELIIPRKNRKAIIRKIEKRLGFKLYILGPPTVISVFSGTMLLVSLFGFILEWQAPLLGVILSLLLIIVANALGKEINAKTLGEIAEKMAKYNYSESRRNDHTINKTEVHFIVHEIIRDFA